MIIDFSVENYRSIKDEVVLSAVALRPDLSDPEPSGGSVADDEVATPQPVQGHSIALLPALCLFGANASGKSNVLMALDYLLSMMTYGSPEMMSMSSRPRAASPFLLDAASADSPTRFQVRLAIEQCIYTYSLGLVQNKILEEVLECRPAGSVEDRLLFRREVDEGSGRTKWENGEDLDAPQIRQQDRIQEQQTLLGIDTYTRPGSLIEKLFRWLRLRWVGIGLGHETFDRRMALAWLPRLPPEMLGRVAHILKSFDTGIADFEIGPADPAGAADALDVFVYHDMGTGRIKWLLEEESTGTRRLFFLMFQMLYAFEAGTPMMVDELGSDVHPAVTRAIVRMFQKESTNPRRAQLLFTSHDNTLQRDHILRRDEIWFTQKRPDGSTDLYPLADFRLRDDLALDRAYLDGRFGAVPLIPQEERVLEVAGAPV